METTRRRVTSADGVGLAVYESGRPGAPTIVAVHGYPDNHTVWDGVAAILAERFHVVTYDVRGTGASDKPAAVGAYRMPQLGEDLAAVIDAVRPDGPVHLLAHDWGSIQAWPAVAGDRLAGRIATFTSISGPSLDYSAVWMRQLHKHPRATLRQLAHSYYTLLFQLPRLPELAARRGLIARAVRASGRRDRSASTAAHPVERGEADLVNGLALYRANMWHHLSRARPVATDIAVQVIAPEDDAFVTPELAIGSAEPWVADLTVQRVAGGHWVVTDRPDVIARLAADFVVAS